MAISSIQELHQTIQESLIGKERFSLDEEWGRLFVLSEAAADIRHDKLNQIHNLALNYARKNKNQLKKHNYEPEDFAQEVVVNMFRRKGLDAYDDEKTHAGLEPVIFRIARNHLIDIERKSQAYARTDDAGNPIHPTSLETPTGKASKMADKELVLGDLIGDERTGDVSFVDMVRLARETIKRQNLRRKVVDDPTRPGGKRAFWTKRRADAVVVPKRKIIKPEVHRGTLYRDYLLAKAGLA